VRTIPYPEASVNDVPLGKLGATQLVEREIVISGEWRHESFPIRFRVTRRGE